MGQETELFNFNWGWRFLSWPSHLKSVAEGKIVDIMPYPLRMVAHTHHEAMRTVFSVGWELMHCPHRGHHHQLIQCLGRWIMHFANPLHWMPHPVKTLANGRILDLLPNPVKSVAQGRILDLLPSQVKSVAQGRILDLVPEPVRKVADGRIMGLLPDALNKVAGGNIMGLLPDPLNKVAGGNIMDLLPGQLHHIARGNIMALLPWQLNKIVHGRIMHLLPEPVQLIAGGQADSIRTTLTLGNELMKCANPTSQGDLVQCLGFKIVGSVPPLNFLNRLGDIFSEFIEAFAKVAATVATQAMKGGQSLLQVPGSPKPWSLTLNSPKPSANTWARTHQKTARARDSGIYQVAATTEFPSADSPPMVHHRGRLRV